MKKPLKSILSFPLWPTFLFFFFFFLFWVVWFAYFSDRMSLIKVPTPKLFLSPVLFFLIRRALKESQKPRPSLPYILLFSTFLKSSFLKASLYKKPTKPHLQSSKYLIIKTPLRIQSPSSSIFAIFVHNIHQTPRGLKIEKRKKKKYEDDEIQKQKQVRENHNNTL